MIGRKFALLWVLVDGPVHGSSTAVLTYDYSRDGLVVTPFCRLEERWDRTSLYVFLFVLQVVVVLLLLCLRRIIPCGSLVFSEFYRAKGRCMVHGIHVSNLKLCIEVH